MIAMAAEREAVQDVVPEQVASRSSLASPLQFTQPRSPAAWCTPRRPDDCSGAQHGTPTSRSPASEPPPVWSDPRVDLSLAATQDMGASPAMSSFSLLFTSAIRLLFPSVAMPLGVHIAVLLGLLPVWQSSWQSQYCVLGLSCATVLGMAVMLVVCTWKLSTLVMHSAVSLQEMFGSECEPVRTTSNSARDSLLLYLETAALTASRRRSCDDRKRADSLAAVRDDIGLHSDSPDGYAIIQGAGTILWCNAALERQFRYDPGELLGQNVRLLMPAPYDRQHDAYLQRYHEGWPKKVVGCCRRVPVKLKDGTLTTAILEVQQRRSESDLDSLFLGRLSLRSEASSEDPVASLQRVLAAGPVDIPRCFAHLDTHPHCVVVINATGIIQYANDSATMLLNYGFGELLRKNVSCLMMEEHARMHDALLARYQERALKAAESGCLPLSHVVDRPRDFYVRTKDGRLLRVYLSVRRVDRSASPADCLFVGTLLLIQRTKSPGEGSGAARPGPPSPAPGAPPTGPAPRWQADEGRLGRLSRRQCTVVAVDVYWEGAPPAAAYQALLQLLASLCIRHQGAIQHPLGQRLFCTFNLEVPNAAHRSSAGAFVTQLLAHWRAGGDSSCLQLLCSATSSECIVGGYNRRPVLLTQAFDVCAMLLGFAWDAAVEGCVLDAPLYEELQYAHTCRVINVMTIHSVGDAKPQTRFIYELLGAKDVKDDTWLYQLLEQPDEDPLAMWCECWVALTDAPVPDYPQALRSLDRHLSAHPRDRTAQWLAAALRRGAPLPRVGRVRQHMFVLHWGS